MSIKPPVFISYKRGDPDTLGLLDALLPRLTRFDVRIDHGFVDLGQAWRQRIFTEIHAARAAVIVLSPAALTSEWVPLEAAILQSRSIAVGDALPVFPVWVGGLTPADLDTPPLSTVRFVEVQGAKVPVGGDPSAAVDAVVTALEGSSAGWPVSAMEKLEALVAGDVAEARIDVLADALRLLGGRTDPLPADLPKAVARALLAPRDVDAWLQGFLGLLPHLRHSAGRVRAATFPFAWVPRATSEAAWRDGSVADDLQLLASYADFTPRQVLAAAMPSALEVPIQPLPPPADEGAADLGEQVRAHLVTELVAPGRSAGDDVLRAKLGGRAKRGRPVWLALQGASAAVVQVIRARWPELRLFLVTADGPPGVRALPALPDGCEDYADELYHTAKVELDRELARG